jgi:DNA repair protein RecN (Recombination protein N)
MLSELNIKNIALIDSLSLKFSHGLNILSGETGAGKSIIIDALNFVLGERADKSLIRAGTDFATVEAVFGDYQTPEILEYLDDLGFEAEEILVLFRKMTQDGKNECRVNGRTVTLSMLKGLTELLCDILGQHEHQSLLNVRRHIALLDMLSPKISELSADIAAKLKIYKEIKDELERLGDAAERARRIEIYSYQVEEIERAKIYEGEEEELLERRRKIRNMEKILSALEECAENLDGGEGSALSKIKAGISRVNSISEFDNRLEALSERLESARIEIKDVSAEISAIRDELGFDSYTAEKIEERLETVRKILRKYGGDFSEMTKFFENTARELETLKNADERVEELQNQLKTAEKTLVFALKEATKERKQTAKNLEERITSELSELGMGGSTFKAAFREISSEGEMLEHATQNGCDSVEFLISPNVGEPLKPLAKIISGGEMSRFMLALKNILDNQIKTLVFDEIDTGISGHIAEVVARKLCRISRGAQVLAVTHLPQLAAMADSHYLIEKFAENGKTVTRLKLLSDNLPEIARLIGGSDYSGHALPHAKEMKEHSKKFKSSIGK